MVASLLWVFAGCVSVNVDGMEVVEVVGEWEGALALQISAVVEGVAEVEWFVQVTELVSVYVLLGLRCGTMTFVMLLLHFFLISES